MNIHPIENAWFDKFWVEGISAANESIRGSKVKVRNTQTGSILEFEFDFYKAGSEVQLYQNGKNAGQISLSEALSGLANIVNGLASPHLEII